MRAQGVPGRGRRPYGSRKKVGKQMSGYGCVGLS